MLLAALGVVLTAGSMRLTDIVNAQSHGWYILKEPIGFVDLLDRRCWRR